MVAPVRVLQLHNYYALLGGEDTIADTEAEILERAGHAVERLRARNPEGGGAAVRALARAPWSRAWYEQVSDRVAAEPFDVAHVHNTWYAMTPSVVHALKDRGVPVVMELQNYRQICVKAQLFRNGGYCTDCLGKHPWRGVVHRCYRSSAAQSAFVAATITRGRARGTWDLVDRYVAPSSFVKSVFVEAGTAPERITVKPSVVPDAGPRPEPPSSSATVLYAGRLHPEKGVDILLDAWREAKGDLGGLELEVIGDGPLRQQLERVAPDGVRFAGHVTPAELSTRMLRARALVFPSQWPETFGRTIVEGFSAGLPALATDFAGPGELARQLGPAWVTDPLRWASALPRLLDAAAVDEAGRRARELYEIHYNPEAGLRRLEAAYESVLRPAGAPVAA
jgi:glycosyltransferase involved in cell wall biosynthesis